ncbi:Protein of uncharacterised function (DUF2786) [Serratia quinivorans]|jgi:hypothetical protein|uniref:Protein of uncharacterized function (DUF2786) n=2 Tax=Serratia TaxID=613 RepID=A0A379ZXT4_9GAMM|nr:MULTISPECIES: DUF2786 domain-containing protein [Serratia]RYM63288.1 hypothetical protein BSR03_08390 [Serratia proteamaculans]CAI1886707.1 Protein of uncharacterised function (DUF2786) [Serratia quinivorans]CAI2024505.1 Protein of uncharacterised function (DUF2786) [Serratia quinivorans]SUI70140.1 Protein of uncharacterised function (DUF2786) [Serratia quinivorans]
MSHSQRQVRLVKLVRKLLELARSNSNAHEAGLALARAQKLMEKYGISELEASLSSIQTAPSQGAPSEAKQKLPEWMSGLAWAIARAFGCRLYFSWRDTPSGQRRNVTFYGFSERPAVAAYAFDVLSRQLKDATADYLKTQNKRLKMSTRRARAEQFRAGWVAGVRRVITTFTVTEQECDLMGTWLENQKMGELKTRAPKACRGDDIARLRGYEAGQNARLHQGVQSDGPVAIAHRIGGE